MVGHLTPYNLFKVNLFKEEISSQPAFKAIGRVMIANTSKSGINLFTWHCLLAHPNDALVK